MGSGKCIHDVVKIYMSNKDAREREREEEEKERLGEG